MALVTALVASEAADEAALEASEATEEARLEASEAMEDLRDMLVIALHMA